MNLSFFNKSKERQRKKPIFSIPTYHDNNIIVDIWNFGLNVSFQGSSTDICGMRNPLHIVLDRLTSKKKRKRQKKQDTSESIESIKERKER